MFCLPYLYLKNQNCHFIFYIVRRFNGQTPTSTHRTLRKILFHLPTSATNIFFLLKLLSFRFNSSFFERNGYYKRIICFHYFDIITIFYINHIKYSMYSFFPVTLHYVSFVILLFCCLYFYYQYLPFTFHM